MPACNDLFAALCRIISERTGLRMNRWAKSRLERILPKRLATGVYRQASEYYHFLRDDPSSSLEITHLVSEITTCRPRLLHADVSDLVSRCVERAAAERITPNILIAGATAAEDAYSAVITIACMKESCNDIPAITAADFDLERLSSGIQGVFTSRALAGLDDAIRRTWLDEPEPRRFQAKPRLREAIRWLFTPLIGGCNRHLASIRWDLIICRRMFCHMNSRALGRWKGQASLLAPGGLLACDRRLNLPPEVQPESFGRLWLHHAPDAAGHAVRKTTRAQPARSAGTVPPSVADSDESFVGAHRIERAMTLLRARQVDEARSQALSALAIEPHSPEALLACGMVFERAGNPVAAGRYYRKALMIRPTMAAAFLQLAELHKNAAQLAEAEKLYRCMPDMPSYPPGVAFPA